MTEQVPKTRRLRVSVGALLGLGFGGLTLIAVAGELALGILSARENTRTLLSDKAEAMVEVMVQQVESLLDPVAHQAAWISDEVAAGRIDPADGAAFDRFVKGALAATPQVSGIAFLFADQSVRRYQRRNSKMTTTKLAGERAAERIEDARQLAGRTWSEPFWASRFTQTVINLQTPLMHDGRFLGLMVQAVTINDLSRSLTVKAGASGQVPFILYDRTRVLAHPYLMSWAEKTTDDAPVPSLVQLNDPILAGIWSENSFEIELLDPTRRFSSSGIEIGGRTFIFIHRVLDRFGDRPWTVGTYFDAETAGAEVRRLQITALSGVGILVLAVAVAVLIGRLTGRPIRRLAIAARGIREGHLETVAPLPASRIRELDEAAASFNEMVDGLRERRLIRELFGRFVPESVAAALLNDQGALSPQTCEATILFADLAGFTALSERLRPEDIVSLLNAYFTVLVEIVERHGGVVTQFQGDAILATFNVPLADPDHARRALDAASEICDAVAKREFAGHRLACRIGVNTGEVVAGNVGAKGRMNYTVHGDAVNLAARLEQLNKEHGTAVLVAASTAALAPDVPLRAIGSVAVRGKSESVAVYTLDS
jgi:adenylate cyclase